MGEAGGRWWLCGLAGLGVGLILGYAVGGVVMFRRARRALYGDW